MLESQLELAGPGTDDYPAARPVWSKWIGFGRSILSAACRSARAIRSRGVTLCSSSVSSETSSRNGVRSSTPGSPPVLATRLALAAWAVRRAWSARRPATRPLRRVPSANVRSRPVPGLTGVSEAAPGCVSGAAAACDPQTPQSPHFAILDGLACMTGRHASRPAPVATTITSNSRSRSSWRRMLPLSLFRKPIVLWCTRRQPASASVRGAVHDTHHRASARTDDPDRRPSWPTSSDLSAAPYRRECAQVHQQPSSSLQRCTYADGRHS